MAASDLDQWRGFLERPVRPAILSTVRGDGRPHVAPIWFALDGDHVVFTTGAETVKGRNLVRDPRVALCVQDERPPFSFVLLQGRAHLDDDPAHRRSWAAHIGGRYMGADRAEEFGARNGVAGELLVRVHVARVTGGRNVAD